MVLDNEQQRVFLLEVFKQVNFPGGTIEVANGVLQAIKRASVAPASVPAVGPPLSVPSMGRQDLARASDDY